MATDSTLQFPATLNAAQKTIYINRIYSRLTVLAVVVFIATLSACEDGAIPQPKPTTVSSQADQSDASHNGIDHNTERKSIAFTDSNDDVWPPQPTGITNVASLNTVSALDTEPLKKQKSARQNKILSSSEIKSLLGDNFVWLADNEIAQKSDKTKLPGASVDTTIETEIFAYDTNQLVTVTTDKATSNLIDYQVTEAATYQPPESQFEVRKAIALASAALLAQGFTEHEQLTGTALLAFPSSAEAAESGLPFYSDRKLYVTFGPGNGVLPHYRATVNLSLEIVEDSGAIE